MQSSVERASPPRQSIGRLTRAMADGDESAWRIFHDAYFDRLWRYLLVVAAGDEEAAREALQGAMIRAARHVKVFHDEQIFWSWLTVLARTALADEAKKSRRRLAFLERFSRHAEAANDPGHDGAADEKLREWLERSVSALPPDERELVAQKYFARRAVRDIAAEWQTTEKAVESKLSRVRRKLRAAVLAGLKNESRRE